jgi:hypothetical protein
LVNLDDSSRVEAERIIENEVSSVVDNPGMVRGNGCAACHVLFKVKESMKVSEQDAADLLSEVLLDNSTLNDRFIAMVEDIHMKSRMMGTTFAIKNRDAKDRYIEGNFRNTLSELGADVASYGAEIMMRKLILSHMALNIAQNLGIDYHAATEELYYYMRKHDSDTHSELMELVDSILRRGRQR